MPEIVAGHQKGGACKQEAQSKGQVQRLEGEGHGIVEGKREQLEPGIAGAARLSCGVFHIDLGFLESHPLHEGRGEPDPVPHVQNGLDDVVVVDAEVGDFRVFPGSGEVREEAIEHDGALTLQPPVLPDFAAGTHQMEPFLCLPKEVWDFFRSVLQVAIHDDHPLTACVGHAGRDGVVLAEIS